MFSRRAMLMAGGLALAASPVHAKSFMTDGGFYREDWFLDSFLELANDLQSTVASGKQLAIMWEQRGCPYCQETHLVNFAQKNIETYIRDHFEILELDLHGARAITDFDGRMLGERQLAARYGIRFTPTIQFFPDNADLAGRTPREREITRIQGYLAPKDFLRMFAFVGDHAYQRGTLRDYLRRSAPQGAGTGG